MSTKGQSGSLGFRHFDHAQDFFELRVGRDGTDLGLQSGRITDLRILHHLDKACDERIVDAFLKQEARTGHAGLAGSAEHAGNCTFNGLLNIRVVKHDVGRLATEFQRDLLEAGGRQLVDLLTGRVAAGERDLRRQLVPYQRLADLRPKAGDDVHHAFGKASLLTKLGKFE